jgi:hypothetical protein
LLSQLFSLVREELRSQNYSLAAQLLNECRQKLKSKSDKALFNALETSIPTLVLTKTQPVYQGTKLSELDHREVIPGISIVTCCMNRNDNLVKALQTWLALPVDEIIIVDWSSSPTVNDSISHIQDDRIKVVRVEGEPKWILTYGFNVGLRFASYSKIYKFDADIQVSTDFLQKNTISSNLFVRGYWKEALDRGEDNQMYVNGSFGCEKEALKEIGYYNELIRTYGWDDSDLYERLSSQQGLSTKYLDFHSVLHLEQKEEDRTIHQDVITDSFLGRVKSTEFNNHRNKFIGRMTDYWNIHRLQNYKLESRNGNSWVYRRISPDIKIPSYIIDDANRYAAIHYLWIHRASLIDKSRQYSIFANLIYCEYAAGVNFDTSLNLLGESNTNDLIYCYSDEFETFDLFIDHCMHKALELKINIFAVVKGEQYQRETLGYHGSNVELVVLNADMFNMISHFWSENQVDVQGNISNQNTSSQIITDSIIKHKKSVVYVDAQHGLGNRIRAIGSGAAIAKQSNRELVIVWEPDHHCECRFADLFDYAGKVIEKTFTDEARNYMDVYNYMEIEPGSEKNRLVVLANERDVYLRAAYTFNHSASHWDAENEFIRSLKPTADIQAMINDIDLSSSIAAHIRMEAGAGLDNNTYDSVENWTQDGHDQLHFWREKSHYSNFIKRVDQLFAENNELTLFLATDLPETYKVFEEYYGDKLVYLKREVYDRSKEQIKYALADALLLSKAQKLLGSTWSSFSELAMRTSTTYSSIEMSGKDF